MKKITLDTSCINIKPHEMLDKIFDLAKKGDIELFFTDAFNNDVLTGKEDVEQLPVKPRTAAKKRISKANKLEKLKSGFKFLPPYYEFPIKFPNEELFEKIRKIVPQNAGEEDIRHLVAHKNNNNDIFITLNKKHFIDNGIREKLKNIGIYVKTPEEFLNEL